MESKRLLALMVFLSISLPLCAQNLSILEKSTVEVASNVGKSVVSVSTVVSEKIGRSFYFGSPLEEFDGDSFQKFFNEFFGVYPEREYKRIGLGSGVIIDKEGYILTNEHVIKRASQIKVKLYDGREFDAEIVGSDERIDLAVIKIDAKNLEPAKLGNSNNLKIGKWVIAIGNPFGFAIGNPEPTITVGVISALNRYIPALGRRNRDYNDLIQTDAAINPGNSGGALVNLNGEVVGINTAIITTTGGYQGLGFAIPINKAKKILKKLLKGEQVEYGWLGVNIQNLNDDLRNYFGIKEKEGVIVLKVYENSPADIGGVEEGDLILEFNKQAVRTTRDLIRMVSSVEVGEAVHLNVVRSGRKKVVKVKIERLPVTTDDSAGIVKAEKVSFRGMTVANITPFYKRKFNFKEDDGVIVSDVEDGSLADKSGFMRGDVIIKVESKKVHNKKDFKNATSKIKGNCLVKTNKGYFILKAKGGTK